MNNGKICISVCAETADEILTKIKSAEDLADIIEIRLDCVANEQFFKTFAFLVSKKLLLLTYRPKEQGGKIEADKQQRIVFWNVLPVNGLLNKRKFWIDCEYDLKSEILNLKFKKIISFHDFKKAPQNLELIFDSLFEKNSVSKIAVQANEITDSLAVWKLLEKAKSENKQLIPIAMGEAGKWTRILGLAHGSPLTYASLETGNETAPGQISAKDLIDVYRVKQLNEQTGIYGIIGNPVSHSLSPYMHNAAFKHYGLNAVYIPFEVTNLDEFIKRMVREETREIDWNLQGFSITIPHKEAIMKHLDFIDDDAKEIGAVNTVKIVDKRLCGYNTDAHGFIEPLRNSYGDLKDANIGIIGNGGAARACLYALKKDGANVTIFARNIKKASKLADEFDVKLEPIENRKSKIENIDILVNTTPLGTVGNSENKTPATAEQIKNIQLAYDLVYNPFETLFLREAKSVDIPTIGGLAMLVAQGTKQFEIWTELDAPMQIMSLTALQRLK
ncbi:MAG: shikimate dehydrogenase [Aridibacter sp.]